jgi:hypothetical protein
MLDGNPDHIYGQRATKLTIAITNCNALNEFLPNSARLSSEFASRISEFCRKLGFLGNDSDIYMIWQRQL